MQTAGWCGERSELGDASQETSLTIAMVVGCVPTAYRCMVCRLSGAAPGGAYVLMVLYAISKAI